jgi:P27 family predicted phage terminase small subunit
MAALRAPRGLDPAGQATWRSARQTLEAIGENPALSRGAIDRYAAAVSMVAALRAEWKRLGHPAVLTGSRGGVSAHPLPRMIERAERQAAELGELLGLSPLARRKLGRHVQGGRPPGAASAPDRAAPPRRALRTAGTPSATPRSWASLTSNGSLPPITPRRCW